MSGPNADTWSLKDERPASLSPADEYVPIFPRLLDRVLFPTGSHNPHLETGEDCMVVQDQDTAREIVENTNLQVVIVAPPSVVFADRELLDSRLDAANPLELVDTVRSLGRNPLLLGNTTRSRDSQTAIARAKETKATFKVDGIKLEVVKTVPYKHAGSDIHRLVPDDREIMHANWLLNRDGLRCVPIMSCYPGTPYNPQVVASKLLGDGAVGIRLCCGIVGTNSGFVGREGVNQFRTMVDHIKSLDENIPVIAEGGMEPASIEQALSFGADAALANYYVSSAADPVQAALDCLVAAVKGRHRFTGIS